MARLFIICCISLYLKLGFAQTTIRITDNVKFDGFPAIFKNNIYWVNYDSTFQNKGSIYFASNNKISNITPAEFNDGWNSPLVAGSKYLVWHRSKLYDLLNEYFLIIYDGNELKQIRLKTQAIYTRPMTYDEYVFYIDKTLNGEMFFYIFNGKNNSLDSFRTEQQNQFHTIRAASQKYVVYRTFSELRDTFKDGKVYAYDLKTKDHILLSVMNDSIRINNIKIKDDVIYFLRSLKTRSNEFNTTQVIYKKGVETIVNLPPEYGHLQWPDNPIDFDSNYIVWLQGNLDGPKLLVYKDEQYYKISNAPFIETNNTNILKDKKFIFTYYAHKKQKTLFYFNGKNLLNLSIDGCDNVNAKLYPEGVVWNAYPVVSNKPQYHLSEIYFYSDSTTNTFNIDKVNNIKTYYKTTDKKIAIEINAESFSNYTCSLYDIHGKQIFQKNLKCDIGINKFNIPAFSISQGIYFISVIGGNNKEAHTNKIFIIP